MIRCAIAAAIEEMEKDSAHMLNVLCTCEECRKCGVQGVKKQPCWSWAWQLNDYSGKAISNTLRKG